jgi:hypothetical protein
MAKDRTFLGTRDYLRAPEATPSPLRPIVSSAASSAGAAHVVGGGGESRMKRITAILGTLAAIFLAAGANAHW